MAIEVVGVYEVPNNPDASLVEVRADRPPSGIDVTGFTQEVPNVDRAEWQAPYDERYLNSEGTLEIGERWAMGWKPQRDVREPATSRLTFFMHNLDRNRPLITPDGQASLPDRVPIPERLAFIEYESPD